MSIFEIRSFLDWLGITRGTRMAEVVHSGQDRRTSPTGHGLHGWDDPDHSERLRILGTLGIRVLVARGRISFLLVRGRGRRLLLHTSLRTRARIEHE